MILITLTAALIPHLFQTFKSKTITLKFTGFEVVILLLTYCFLAFNIVSMDINFSMGYFAIGVLGIYIASCMLFVLKKVFKGLKNRLRYFFITRAYKRHREVTK